MNKLQAGIAVIGVAMVVGVAGVCYQVFQPKADAVASLQIPPGSPRSVVYDLLKGMQEGNAELIRRAMHARDEHEDQAVEVLVGNATASGELIAAGDRAFGPGRFRPSTPTLLRPDLMAQVAQLNEVVDGELAEVDLTPPSSPSVVHLRKVDGRWKVMVRDTFDPLRTSDAGPVAGLVSMYRIQVTVYATVRGEIEQGNVTTPEAAQLALNQRTSEALRRTFPGSGLGRRPATERP